MWEAFRTTKNRQVIWNSRRDSHLLSFSSDLFAPPPPPFCQPFTCLLFAFDPIRRRIISAAASPERSAARRGVARACTAMYHQSIPPFFLSSFDPISFASLLRSVTCYTVHIPDSRLLTPDSRSSLCLYTSPQSLIPQSYPPIHPFTNRFALAHFPRPRFSPAMPCHAMRFFFCLLGRRSTSLHAVCPKGSVPIFALVRIRVRPWSCIRIRPHYTYLSLKEQARRASERAHKF